MQAVDKETREPISMKFDRYQAVYTRSGADHLESFEIYLPKEGEWSVLKAVEEVVQTAIAEFNKMTTGEQPPRLIRADVSGNENLEKSAPSIYLRADPYGVRMTHGETYEIGSRQFVRVSFQPVSRGTNLGSAEEASAAGPARGSAE